MISIVTISYNNIFGLKRTFDSVFSQNNLEFEFIVIDGESDDGTVEFLSEMSLLHDFRFISEPDDGIFDALNKGISLSNNDWIICMNSGDTFYGSDAYEHLLSASQAVSEPIKVIYGDCFLISENKVVKARRPEAILNGNSFCSHQSMIIRREFTYNQNMKIYGDLDLIMNIFSVFGKDAFLKLPYVISKFEGGGISDRVSVRKRFEKYYSLFSNFGALGLFRTLVERFIIRKV